MAKRDLEFDLDEVLGFVRQRIPGLRRAEGMQAIGLRSGGDMIAGVIYEGFTARNVWMHVAARPGAPWATPEFLRACFCYPFNVCRLDRVGAWVDESNTASARLVERLGFVPETLLDGVATDGGRSILYVMWKKDCRYV
jgi:hypothetical protein